MSGSRHLAVAARLGRSTIAAVALAVVMTGGVGTTPAAAANREAILRVEGMVCPNCENTVELVLGRVDGVVEVSAERDLQRARVIYDPAAASTRELVSAVNTETYYRASLTDGRSITTAASSRAPVAERPRGLADRATPVLAGLALAGALGAVVLRRVRRRHVPEGGAAAPEG